jgi:hypothetical protein
MYQFVCKFGLAGGEEENGFHIWPREDDRQMVKGKAKVIF